MLPLANHLSFGGLSLRGLCFLAVVLSANAAAQTKAKPPTLTDTIKGMHWVPDKSGPLLVLDLAGVRGEPGRTGLAAFGRKRMEVGGLTAIVPNEMVLIDDSLRQPPNLYDGLPADAKVLYLLKSLNSEQMRLATGRGVGMVDLQGEQRAVFSSLLPRPFRWKAFRVDKSGRAEKELEKGSLSDTELNRVRLRISRGLSFQMDLENQRGYTEHTTNEEYGSPGDTVVVRDDNDDFDRGDMFGIQIRQKVENKPKASDLDYANHGLDKPVTPAPSVSVRKLLQQIGASTGQEIYADLRIADLKVESLGAQARAGDLLKAVALMVTGTYRRVGNAYVLTSDLAGMGARKLRLALWQANIQREVYERQQEWRMALGKGGAFDKAPFDETGDLGPNGAVMKHLESEGKTYGRERFSSQELSPELRGFLQRVNVRYSGQKVNTEQVGVQSFLQYGFVLPDGRALRAEMQSMGPASMFEERPPYVRPEPPKVSPVAVPSNGAFPILLRTQSVEQARQAVAEARAHGFAEVWLETREAASLQAALTDAKKAGMTVRLAIRPWVVEDEPNPQDPDRTILGDTGSQLAARRLTSSDWKQYVQNETPLAEAAQDLVPPIPAAVNSRWAAFANLASTPGLAGVAVLGSQPHGYEYERTEAIYGGYSPAVIEMQAFGYSDALRLAFIRSKGIDPIDIAEQKLMVDADLRQPFFLDDALRGSSSIYDGRNAPNPAMQGIQREWVNFRSLSNKAATEALLASLQRASGAPSLLIEMRRAVEAPTKVPLLAIVPWAAGEELPSYSVNPQAMMEPKPGTVAAFPLPGDWPLEKTDNRPAMVNSFFANPATQQDRKITFLIDASQLPSARLGAMLDHWFKRSSER